ncbi:MAG: phenylalanine--tRNA ligase subunit beta [Pseudomonadota bacterium]
MRISLNWLKEYVDIDVPAENLAERLTMAGLEVESIESYSGNLDRVLVGLITEIALHPNAEKLFLCRIAAGENAYRIVCGAENIRLGDKVPLALDGAIISGKTVSKSLVRGEVSEGVLCSAGELGLGQDSSGIMILPDDLQPGWQLAQAIGLDDRILEISLTPNRGDCLSILGIAREVGALLNKRVRYPEIKLAEGIEDIKGAVSVAIEAPDACYRYSARIVKNVEIAESPLWLRVRLLALGIRPINNVVDITNYVLMEYGQPLHAFDLDHIEANKIIVKKASEGSTFETLDGISRTLSRSMLMIADPERDLAVAGVMGGKNSEIGPDTTSVLIESAYFDPVSVRRTSRRLNLSTESSYRFERGVDIEAVVTALDRAAALMADLAKGHVLKGHIDEYPTQKERKPVSMDLNRANLLLGTSLEKGEMRRLLEGIGVGVRETDKNGFSLLPPSFRYDLERDIDFMEEMARLNGYDRIPVKVPVSSVTMSKRKKERTVGDICRSVLIGLGFYEIISYSFMNEKTIDRLNISNDDRRRRFVRLLNPLTEDQSVLRTSMIPNLLSIVAGNQRQGNLNLSLFEVGKVFLAKDKEELPDEETHLAGLCAGLRYPEGPHFPEEKADFFDIKGAVQAVLQNTGIEDYELDNMVQDAPYLHAGAAVRIVGKQGPLGFIGQVDPPVCEGFGLKDTVYAFELFFDELVSRYTGRKCFKPLPKYPAILRDIAFVVPESVPAGEVMDEIRDRCGNLLEKAFVFDVYRGKQIEKGYKSLALRLVYRSLEKTLEDEEINVIHTGVLSHLVSRFEGRLRE